MKRSFTILMISTVMTAFLMLPLFSAPSPSPGSQNNVEKIKVINRPKTATTSQPTNQTELKKADDLDIQALNSPSPCILQAVRFLSPQSIPMLTSRLKLTSDQQTQVKDLINKLEDTMQPLVRNQKVEAESFVKGLTMSQLREPEVNAAAKSAANAELAIITEKVKTLFALRQILTPDQNKELDGLIKSQSVPWTIGRPTPPVDAIPAPAKGSK